MDAERKNYYEVLEVETNATPQQIEASYVRSKNAYTGDSVALYSLMTKDECDRYLGEIEEAYAVLGFPEKRKEYDRHRGLNQSGYAPQRPSASTTNEGTHQYENFGSNLNEAKVSKIVAQQKFALEYTPNDEMERKIQDTTDFTGPFLKSIREYKNMTIERLAELTRVSKTHLNAIENEDLPKLPADVYVRGYVYQFAKVLKLNPEQVAASYMLSFKKLKASR